MQNRHMHIMHMTILKQMSDHIYGPLLDWLTQTTIPNIQIYKRKRNIIAASLQQQPTFLAENT